MKIDGRKIVSLEAREKRRVKALAWWERARNIARYYPCTPKEASGVMQELRFEPWLLKMLETGVPWAIKKAKNLIRGRRARFKRWYKGAQQRYEEAMKR